jgi:hypothetical protein
MYAFNIPITASELNATGGIVMKTVNAVAPPAPTGYPVAFANAIVIDAYLNVSETYRKYNNDFLLPRITADYNSSGEYNNKLVYDTPSYVTKTRTTISRPRQMYILNTSGVILDYLVLSSAIEEQDFIKNPTRYIATSIATSQAITIMPFQSCYRLLIKKNGGSATTTVNITLSNYIIVEQ